MVLGHGFDSWLHLKTRWKDLMAEKVTKKKYINKGSQIGQARPKKIKN